MFEKHVKYIGASYSPHEWIEKKGLSRQCIINLYNKDYLSNSAVFNLKHDAAYLIKKIKDHGDKAAICIVGFSKTDIHLKEAIANLKSKGQIYIFD